VSAVTEVVVHGRGVRPACRTCGWRGTHVYSWRAAEREADEHRCPQVVGEWESGPHLVRLLDDGTGFCSCGNLTFACEPGERPSAVRVLVILGHLEGRF